LTLAIWAVYDYYQIREAKNSAHCRVSTIRQTLLADSILNFISFGISLFYCCIYSLETWFLENDNAREAASLLGNNDNNNNNNNDERKRSHPYSSLCTSCKGLLAAGSLIVIIYLTVATFYAAKVSKYCYYLCVYCIFNKIWIEFCSASLRHHLSMPLYSHILLPILF
jgi:hypothetical protein